MTRDLEIVRFPQSARGLAHSKTLRVLAVSGLRASVLERGGPPPLFLRRSRELFS